ncbi:MAG: SpoIIE family protein phosphatase [Candidatus Auribacterota bacterium]|jgi:hypothetical protein|nr:SpoIIE family protein phosphatase [Candidatus Auribacterota bacterium]
MMKNSFVDIYYKQSSKRPGDPCGDVVVYKRDAYHTTILLVDGIGSGIKAHIAATMNSARIMQMLADGFSVRDVFSHMVKTMNEWRNYDKPFSAFTLTRIMHDGTATMLSYEAPVPLLLGAREAYVLPAQTLTIGEALVSEIDYHLRHGEGVVLVSDGITQAGIGNGLPRGWTIEGVNGFVNRLVSRSTPTEDIPDQIIQEAFVIDGSTFNDDCTVIAAPFRHGHVVTILTGPPESPADDEKSIAMFLENKGTKIVCGSTTANIVARHLNTEVRVEHNRRNTGTPPQYFIDGIDLVTEGAITLNQLHNILDEDLLNTAERSAVFDLWQQIMESDRIQFMVGKKINSASDDIIWRKQGILPRIRIVNLLAKKLESMGKLVTITYV